MYWWIDGLDRQKRKFIDGQKFCRSKNILSIDDVISINEPYFPSTMFAVVVTNICVVCIFLIWSPFANNFIRKQQLPHVNSDSPKKNVFFWIFFRVQASKLHFFFSAWWIAKFPKSPISAKWSVKSFTDKTSTYQRQKLSSAVVWTSVWSFFVFFGFQRNKVNLGASLTFTNRDSAFTNMKIIYKLSAHSKTHDLRANTCHKIGEFTQNPIFTIFADVNNQQQQLFLRWWVRSPYLKSQARRPRLHHFFPSTETPKFQISGSSAPVPAMETSKILVLKNVCMDLENIQWREVIFYASVVFSLRKVCDKPKSYHECEELIKNRTILKLNIMKNVVMQIIQHFIHMTFLIKV